MEKKTIEYMEAAVTAECKRLCPNDGDRYQFAGWKLMRFENHWSAHHNNGLCLFTTSDDLRVLSDFRNYDLAYRALGLAERDAIAELREESDKYFVELKAERAKVEELQGQKLEAFKNLAELINDHGQALKDLNTANELLQLDVKAEHERNAALIAGLESLKKEHGLDYGLFSFERPVLNNVGEFIDELIEANGKGGLQDDH